MQLQKIKSITVLLLISVPVRFIAAISILMILSISCSKDENTADPFPKTVTDIDGNVYTTIKIGNKLWMVENLKVTKYNNGDPIPNVTDNAGWKTLTTHAYSDYENTPNEYGKLYNFYAVGDARKLAPKGWHVATDAEWQVMVDSLGGYTMAGGKLKEAGPLHWVNSNSGDNSSGFTALPGGFRSGTSGAFGDIGNQGLWWAGDTGTTIYSRKIYSSSSLCGKTSFTVTPQAQREGYSVRCVKD